MNKSTLLQLLHICNQNREPWEKMADTIPELEGLPLIQYYDQEYKHLAFMIDSELSQEKVFIRLILRALIFACFDVIGRANVRKLFLQVFVDKVIEYINLYEDDAIKHYNQSKSKKSYVKI